MAKIITKMYLNSSKDTNYEIGRELNLDDNALDEFVYALYEVEFEVEVDTDTGKSTILKVDGIRIRQPSPEEIGADDDYLSRLGCLSN